MNNLQGGDPQRETERAKPDCSLRKIAHNSDVEFTKFLYKSFKCSEYITDRIVQIYIGL